MRRALPFLSLIFLFAPQFRAADLTKIERTIRKEPIYQSKKPRYCLLVFGPEAKTRIWLVLDGKTLYVDRNGNGDLTDDGEKVIAKRWTLRFRRSVANRTPSMGTCMSTVHVQRDEAAEAGGAV